MIKLDLKKLLGFRMAGLVQGGKIGGKIGNKGGSVAGVKGGGPRSV